MCYQQQDLLCLLSISIHNQGSKQKTPLFLPCVWQALPLLTFIEMVILRCTTLVTHISIFSILKVSGWTVTCISVLRTEETKSVQNQWERKNLLLMRVSDVKASFHHQNWLCISWLHLIARSGDAAEERTLKRKRKLMMSGSNIHLWDRLMFSLETVNKKV